MPVTEADAGLNFNNITQEVYGRVPQVGDNLLQMFEDSLDGGFNIDHDIGAAGPGDAMSEFKGYDHEGIYGGTWEGYYGYRVPALPDSIFKKYFSNGDLLINVQIKTQINSDSIDFDLPISATLTIGGVTITTTDQSAGVGDDILFRITAEDNIPNGIYVWNTDVVVTLTDSSGYLVNATTYSGNVAEFPQFLHIYDKDTFSYRWQWSTSNVDSYPIVYPTITFEATSPYNGFVPGSNSPAIKLKVTDDAGFSDIKAYVSLVGYSEPIIIGSELDGWVTLGVNFTVDTFKTLVFNVDVIADFIRNVGSIEGIDLLPKVLLKFGNGAFETPVVSDITLHTKVYKVSSDDTDTGSHTWSWINL